MIIRLDFPNPALAPNRAAGKHWGGLAALKAKAKADAHALTKNALQGKPSPYLNFKGDIPVSLFYVTPDKRRRDSDGMLSASKHALDGVALALGVDDSRFRPILVDWEHGHDKIGALIVAVGVEIRSGVNLD